jgi:type IX secretion system PorP/SprF family membrane protein
MVARGQDPQFSQFHAAPIYLNPALTGNTYQDRIGLNYRMQWPGIQPGWETYSVAYDHRAASLNSGFGGMVLHDRAGTNGLAFTSVMGAYAYEARIDHKRALRFGLRMGYTMRYFDSSRLLFADQVIRDNAPTTIEQNLIEQVNYLDMGTGALYYTEQFWAGISVNHINQPQQSLFLGGDARLPIRTSVHGGYTFAIDGKRFKHAETTMTLAAHYKAQGKWDQLDIGGYISHQRITGGLWYRGLTGLKAYAPGYPSDDAVILMAGFETNERIRIVYSYDITVSKMTMRSGGAHELSLVYEWPKQAKKRRHRVVPCPKF